MGRLRRFRRSDDENVRHAVPLPVTTIRRFIVMSGLAASGKSALGMRLAEALELDYLDKDDFLEPLFDLMFPRDRTEKSVLSRQADIVFRAAVEASPGAVVVSFCSPSFVSPAGTVQAEVAIVSPFSQSVQLNP